AERVHRQDQGQWRAREDPAEVDGLVDDEIPRQRRGRALRRQVMPRASAMSRETKAPFDADATPMILMENVDKWYGQFQALDQVNLSVGRGEKIVLCG